MDYHHWKETHGIRFRCTCRPLSTTGRVLDRMIRFNNLGIFLTLSHMINNGAYEQTEQNNEPN